MYHMESIDVRARDRSFLYFDTACACANNMLNVANFYIRRYTQKRMFQQEDE